MTAWDKWKKLKDIDKKKAKDTKRLIKKELECNNSDKDLIKK